MIKTAILQGQYEALKGENRVQLAVYFGIGKYISLNSREGKWGTGAWSILDANSSVATDELGNKGISLETQHEKDLIDIHRSMAISSVADFPAEDFLRVPFTHQCVILRNTESLEERYYYIRRCSNEHLSVESLRAVINDDAFHNKRNITNNFSRTLSSTEARKAVMMFKDEYALDHHDFRKGLRLHREPVPFGGVWRRTIP